MSKYLVFNEKKDYLCKNGVLYRNLNLSINLITNIFIPQALLDSCPRIVPASGADDTGVTICYNSVRDPSCVVHLIGDDNVVAINPVNWYTDDTPASLVTVPSPGGEEEQQLDTLTVRLDPATNLLLVNGFTGKDYVLPLIGKEGNYHSREIWLYRKQLRENIALRTWVYLYGYINS